MKLDTRTVYFTDLSQLQMAPSVPSVTLATHWYTSRSFPENLLANETTKTIAFKTWGNKGHVQFQGTFMIWTPGCVLNHNLPICAMVLPSKVACSH